MAEDGNLISVVIPTCDRAETLRKCIEGFSGQTLPRERFEVVVVNDGSTDGTRPLLEALAKEIPRLSVCTQERGGPAKARNLGLRHAKGPVVLITGDDCIPDGKLLEEHLRLHGKGEAVAVLGRVDWHPDLDVTPFMEYLVIDTQFSYPVIEKRPHDVPFCYFYTSNISVPKRCIESAGAFDEDFRDATFEDVELGYRLARSGVRMVYNPRAVTYHYHVVGIEDYARRQFRAGKAAALLYRKHPELAELARVPQAGSPEPRIRYYKAVLDYHYFLGLQEGLESGGEDASLLPFEDRLRNWSNKERDELMVQVQRLEEHRDGLERLTGTQREEIERLHAEVARRDELVSTLEKKNREKYARIVELEKFVDRAKASLPYRLYRLFTGKR